MAGFPSGTGGAKPARCRFLGSRGGVLMSVMLRPATASEIIEICGYLDDGVVTRILATGASPAEVLEGFTWATADDQIGTELRHGRVGAGGAVYEILMQEEPDPEELGR
jgi:hypothetical protein